MSDSSGAPARGQALVEAVIGIAVLSVLAILVVLLGKYQGVAAAGISASRSLAFGCAVLPDGCNGGSAPPELVDSVRAVQLAAPLAPAEEARALPALWHDRGGTPMLDVQSGLSASIETPRFDAGEAVAGSRQLRGIANPLQLVSLLAGPGRFGLETADGIRDAHVELAVQPELSAMELDDRLFGMALAVHANTAVLVDTWSADGPHDSAASVSARVERGRSLGAPVEAALAAGYAPARTLLRLAGAIGLESGVEAFRPDEIDVEIVPLDRLAP